MTRKTSLSLLFLLVIVYGIYSERLLLIKTAVNTLLLPSSIQITRLQALKLSTTDITIGQLVFSVNNKPGVVSLDAIRWDFTDGISQPSQLTVQHLTLNDPAQKHADKTTATHSVSLAQLLRQINGIALKSIIISQLDTHLVADTLVLHWQKSINHQRLTISDSHSQLHLSLSQQAQQIQINTHITARHSNHTKPLINMAATIIPGGNTHTLMIRGDLSAEPLLTWLRHYMDIPRELIAISGQLAFTTNGVISDALDQLSQTVEMADHASITAVLKTTHNSTEYAELDLTLPHTFSLTLNDALTLSSAPLLFSAESAAHPLAARGNLTALACRWPGTKTAARCTGKLTARINAGLIQWQQLQLKKSDLNLSASFVIDDKSLNLITYPGTHFSAEAIHFQQSHVGHIRIMPQASLNAQLSLTRQSGSIELDKLTVMLAQLQHGAMTLAARLAFDNIQLSVSEQISASFRLSTDSMNIRYDKQWLPALALDTTFALQQSQLTASGQIASDRQQRLLNFTAKHDLNTQAGALSFTARTNPFSPTAPLSRYFSGWPFKGDVLLGVFSADGTIKWQNGLINGDINPQLINIHAVYNNSAIIGLTTSARLALRAPDRLTTTQAIELQIQAVDVGIPITDIKATLGFDSLDKRLDLTRVEAHILGGKISTSNASYRHGTSQTIQIMVEKLDLNQALSLSGYDTVQGSGLISGQLPLSIVNHQLRIEQGTLAAHKPGGIIKYHPLTQATNSSVQLVNNALSNYHYHTLASQVHYAANGDLNLAVHMRGKNPDFNQGQAINLNLNVTDNIPMLLRSLQAGRTITDVIEGKLQSSQ